MEGNIRGKTIELKEHQQILLNIVLDFAAFCESHNLKYFLDAGTLLGAVRNKGFIPWDNDIDIGMPREDYDLFLSLMQQQGDQLNDHIVLERPENTIYLFAKVGDSRTELIEFPEKNPISCYAYLDIFPQDGIDQLSFRNRIMCKISEWLRLVHWFNKYSIPCWKRTKKGMKKWVALIGEKITRDLNWGLKLQRMMIRKYSSKHPMHECRYFTTLVNGEFSKCAPVECIKQYCLVEFEGHMFSAPGDFDTYLKCLYGPEYMTPPPPEKVKVHNVIIRWKKY